MEELTKKIDRYKVVYDTLQYDYLNLLIDEIKYNKDKEVYLEEIKNLNDHRNKINRKIKKKK